MKTLIPCIAASLLLSIPAGAQPVAPPPPSDDWCATSPARTEALRERHEWLSSRRIGIRAEARERLVARDGVFIIEADDSLLINDDPLDLLGSTIRLRPGGTGYVIDTLPISYRNDVGEMVRDFGAWPDSHHRIDLPFRFPFNGTEHEVLNVTNRNGIYFDVPAAKLVNQYETFDAVALEQSVISPLLLGKVPATFVSPELFVRKSSDEIVLTWRTDSLDFAYDVQAVLSSDGSIDLSWRSARDVSWGAVVVTPGINATEMSRVSLVTLDDEVNDTGPARADQDLQRLEIGRLDGSDLLEVQIDLRGAVRTDEIAPGEYIQYVLDSGAANRIVVHLTRDGKWILLPGRGWITDPGSLRIDSKSIRFLVTDRSLERGESVSVRLWTWDSAEGKTIDTLYGSFDHAYSDDSFEIDLSASSGRVAARPVIESFTLPDMDPYAVWDLLSAQYGLDPSDTDAIAIYQDFFTDLVLYAGAYSTVGNPGADGVSTRGAYGQASALFPSLLHMSRLGYRYNTSDELSMHVLNHEFGHRWLYFFEITENGASTHSLNPAGGHPAQFVHMPAAFDVRGPRNSSAMGGSWFEDRGNGTFQAGERRAAYGFSWHELYLMGLASADEVEPWYYIAESNPRLGDAYYPPDGIVVSGARRDVTIDQLIESMGERNPDHTRSRKRFSTYFVLLVRDLEALSEAQVADLHHRRRLLQGAIPAATGGRASVNTLFDFGPRKRGVRRP